MTDETPNSPDAVTDEPNVALDLDSLEREDSKGPFPFRHKGRRYLLSDPQEIDWQRLLIAQRDPVYFITLALPADDREAFFASEMPGWKMNKLMERYVKHYGLTSPGEAAGSPA
ncbi:hypothetical protein ACIBTV_27230 [Micromonospora sp. NPDC049366]|uniref:hypothetical protein n=1 Tax=Micromonospora sp. NPDC049366 TaxID=3364271 RepID=UPI0037974F53